MEWFGHLQNEDLFCHHLLDPRPDPAAFTLHTHTQLELLCFLQGQASCRVEGHIYPLHPGDLLLFRAAEAHSMLIDPGCPYERVAIHFSPRLLQQPAYSHLLHPFVQRALGEGNLYPAEQLPQPFVHQCMERLFLQTPSAGGCPQAYLLPLLQEVYTAWRARGPAPQPQELGVQLTAYINRHLADITGLKQLEEQFFLSQSQINRVFRRTTGSSVWAYLQIKRLFAARELLQGGLPPCQAAQSCGYREYSTFFRAYKKQFGRPPQADWRRAGGGGQPETEDH